MPTAATATAASCCINSGKDRQPGYNYPSPASGPTDGVHFNISAAVLMSGVYRFTGTLAPNVAAYFGTDTHRYEDPLPLTHVAASGVPLLLTVHSTILRTLPLRPSSWRAP
jgi:hypothetical protein